MLKSIEIKNLRSIREGVIQIAPITVLYGPNGSGKSTLMHTLAILKKIVFQPHLTIDDFFDLGFANFGGFEQVIFNHLTNEQIKLGIYCESNSTQIFYEISLGENNGCFRIEIGKPWDITLKLETKFPYSTLRHQILDIKNFRFFWDGFQGLVAPSGEHLVDMEDEENALKLASLFNLPVGIISTSDFVHLKRGFAKSHYGKISAIGPIFMEDEIATLLIENSYLQAQVSEHLQQIFQKDLRTQVALGTNLFWLNTIDKATGLITDLINEGFGVNQVVYLLAKCLHKDTEVVCIEEPEIHLHPKALRSVVYALIRITKELKKTIIISTHSEHFVLALLSAVAKNQLCPEELSCYLCTKDGHETKFEHQQVNNNGQIEGGLAPFMEGELEDLKEILGVEGEE